MSLSNRKPLRSALRRTANSMDPAKLSPRFWLSVLTPPSSKIWMTFVKWYFWDFTFQSLILGEESTFEIFTVWSCLWSCLWRPQPGPLHNLPSSLLRHSFRFSKKRISVLLRHIWANTKGLGFNSIILFGIKTFGIWICGHNWYSKAISPSLPLRLPLSPHKSPHHCTLFLSLFGNHCFSLSLSAPEAPAAPPLSSASQIPASSR